ncbi:MAG: Dethiobiotin synthase [Frankiales bacterium]|nr:Dethiobiotin synthase [Frankiales bacterium]
MAVLFVTGTSTDVGKTVVTAAVAALALARGARVAVVKPGQTGVTEDEPGDLAAVERLSGVTECFELVRYPAALSPAAAARACERPPLDPVALYDLVLGLDHDLVLVEGAGGLLVRFDEDGTTLADFARSLRAPVLVVAAPALGTLNHTALTLEALAHRGVELSGIVLGAWPADPGLAERSNLRDLEMLAARPLLGAIPEGSGALTQEDFLPVARASLGPQLGGDWDARTFRQRWDPPPG